jgi:hypothetical protein
VSINTRVRTTSPTLIWDTQVKHQRHRTRLIREITSQFDVPTSLTPVPRHLLCSHFVGCERSVIPSTTQSCVFLTPGTNFQFWPCSDDFIVFFWSFPNVISGPLWLLLLVRLGDYIVTLCTFYFYKLIGKLTVSLHLQEFSLGNITVSRLQQTCHPRDLLHTHTHRHMYYNMKEKITNWIQWHCELNLIAL